MCTDFKVTAAWVPLGYVSVKEQYTTEYGRTFTSSLQASASWEASAQGAMAAGFDVLIAAGAMAISGQTSAAFSAQYESEIQMTHFEERTYDLEPGQAWQCQFFVKDSCGNSTIKGNSVVVTNSIPEHPCCLPGYFLNPTNITNPHCRGVAGKAFHLCKLPPPAPPSEWTEHKGKNCYDGAGATPISNDWPLPGKTKDECQSSCSSWYDWYGRVCTAVVQPSFTYGLSTYSSYTYDSSYSYDTVTSDCWLRNRVTITSCQSDDDFDTYTVDGLGNWTRHAGTNCCPNHGGIIMSDNHAVNSNRCTSVSGTVQECCRM